MATYRNLNEKQRRFCELYVSNGYKQGEAYLEAYGLTDMDSARASACRMLKNQKIREYITQLQKEAFEAQCINAERVATKLAEIAFAQKDDQYYTAPNQLKALDLLQKQLGLQNQKIEMSSQDININIVQENTDETSTD